MYFTLHTLDTDINTEYIPYSSQEKRNVKDRQGVSVHGWMHLHTFVDHNVRFTL